MYDAILSLCLSFNVLCIQPTEFLSDFSPKTRIEKKDPPVQGQPPHYQYPQTPLQIQHLDDLMTKPQPQKNPQGPKVYP